MKRICCTIMAAVAALSLMAEVKMLVLRTEPRVEDVKLLKGTFSPSHKAAVKKVYLGTEKGESRGKDALVFIYDTDKTGKEQIVFTLEKLGYKSAVLQDVKKPRPAVDGMSGATGY